MSHVEIDLANVNDWKSFHTEFAEVMGFPEFYGHNMNAWEDCMSDLSRPNTVGMTKVVVPEGEDLVLILSASIEFRLRQPDIFTALLDSTANLNRMKVTVPGASRLLLLLL
ncbi:barstar family protein [Nostoc sp. FACHB-133]|uniref:barstar family protein n=1 Tax=Nostoc sp. FACHB-133 TaxID=2692835 RepID=UPI001688990C|nr:barstar family protein [Nostoc sp. FACHB-133]MBD2524539.1 barstar family protein [Nostoc sp. FACHB-133]